MLGENQIDNLIQPLVQRQVEIECITIAAIAKRLKQVKEMMPSDVYRLQRLYQSGSDAQRLNKEISKLAEISENEIKKIIEVVAKDAYADAKPFYDYRKLPYLDYAQNLPLQSEVEAIKRTTLEDYKNLSNSTAFMLRDVVNPYVIRPTPLSDVYQSIVDRAVQSVSMGIESYNSLIPKSIEDLTQKGISVAEYTTEKDRPHRIRLDTVVRRNILDGIRDVQQKVQDIVGEQFGADGVELSVHIHSALDHEPIQGHQFTNEEYEKCQTGQSFKDVNGVKYKAIDRPIGAWNCRHFAWSIILSEATPRYTQQELDKIIKDNAYGITYDYNGKQITRSMYWCTQKQRDYELKIRKAKECMNAAELAGEVELEQVYTTKLDKLQNSYKLFCNKCGLKPRFDKTRVYFN